jgi:hypothetical protein
MEPNVKFKEEVAKDLLAKIKAFDFGTIEKLKKAKDENGTFDVIISTEDIDRSGEIVRQDGWDLTNYKNNPIVLWGHDYYSLPVGVCLETYKTTVRGVPALGARGVFLSADINPFAQQVRRLYEYGVKAGAGVGCTTSVGFIPKEFDSNAERPTITKAELLEFSFVPVPANQGVGPGKGRALTLDEAHELGLDTVGMRTKGVEFATLRGAIPENTTDKKAANNAAWKAPRFEDFSEKAWEDLTDEEKIKIASHFAWTKSSVPTAFADLQLPHHRASDGAVVFNGLKSAMQALLADTELPKSDRKAAYDHLAEHYKLFDKKPPEYVELKEAEAGDHCQMDDGSPGILSGDPKDPDGPLVCIPQEQDKSASTEHTSQKALIKDVGDEHTRHSAEVEKAFDTYEDALDSEDTDPHAAMKDMHSSLGDEHQMHRANSVKCFRSFDPAENKAFDKSQHLDALREAHAKYEAKCQAAMGEFATKSTKAFDDNTNEKATEAFETLRDTLDANQRVHKKAVVRIAKAMCKAAFGEDDQADEKTLIILREFLAPHVDAQLLPAVTAKLGSRLATEQKTKLGEAHKLLTAAKSVLEGLSLSLADGSEEEGRSDQTTGLGDVPRITRSRPRVPSPADNELDAHMLGREILRGIEAAARSGLGKLNLEIRNRSKN